MNIGLGVPQQTHLSQQAGYPLWRAVPAPMLPWNSPGSKQDPLGVWGLEVVLYTLVHRVLPFDGQTFKELRTGLEQNILYALLRVHGV